MLLPNFGDKIKDIVQVIADVLFDDPDKHSQLLQAELYPSRARIAYRVEEGRDNLLHVERQPRIPYSLAPKTGHTLGRNAPAFKPCVRKIFIMASMAAWWFSWSEGSLRTV